MATSQGRRWLTLSLPTQDASPAKDSEGKQRKFKWPWKGFSRSPGKKIQHGVATWAAILGGTLAVTCAAYAVGLSEGWGSRLGVFATSIGVCLAAAAIGAVFGFIFGLPRGRFVDLSTGAEKDPTGRPSTHFLMNSNLVKVSDWVTTIIVGLTLVQLGNVGPAINDLSEALESPLGGTENAGVFGVAIVLTSAITGALLMYLFTTVRVRELYEAAEREEDVVQTCIDDAFLDAAIRYVEATPNTVTVSSEDLFTLKRSSRGTAIEKVRAWASQQSGPASGERKLRLLEVEKLLKES